MHACRHTTHVLVKVVDEQARVVQRSLKYLAGLAAGLPVVGWDWVAASLAAGQWVEEDAYIVKVREEGGKTGWGVIGVMWIYVEDLWVCLSTCPCVCLARPTTWVMCVCARTRVCRAVRCHAG